MPCKRQDWPRTSSRPTPSALQMGRIRNPRTFRTRRKHEKSNFIPIKCDKTRINRAFLRLFTVVPGALFCRKRHRTGSAWRLTWRHPDKRSHPTPQRHIYKSAFTPTQEFFFPKNFFFFPIFFLLRFDFSRGSLVLN